MDGYISQTNGKPPGLKLIPKRKKNPVIAVALRYLGDGEWEVTFIRRPPKLKTHHASVEPVKLLTKLIQEFELLDIVTVSPGLTGWTAYVDRAVYPPPSQAMMS